jgi:hypothetical protein
MAIYRYAHSAPICCVCRDSADVTTHRRHISGRRMDVAYCYDCWHDTQNADKHLKSLAQLARDLRQHAYNYILDDGQLAADLEQAANYLEAVANG